MYDDREAEKPLIQSSYGLAVHKTVVFLLFYRTKAVHARECIDASTHPSSKPCVVLEMLIETNTHTHTRAFAYNSLTSGEHLLI